MSGSDAVPLAAVFGCAGHELTAPERDFFARANPLGFTLFYRNCRDPDQVKALVRDFRATVGRPDAPVFIDQEGGRVARLKPPVWPKRPAALAFGRLALKDPLKAEQAVRLNARLITAELEPLGVTVNAAPVLDLVLEGMDVVIGDRGFGADPALVARLGRAQAEGFLDGGILPTIKHMPGHGRSTVDSHRDLPVVEADPVTLAVSDFVPFRANADLPWGMTAHIVYKAIDPERPGTLSPIIINQIIREQLGFGGVLITDDLGMGALSGRIGDRAQLALAAGCDIALHCNGILAEMEEVASAIGPLTPAALARLDRARGWVRPVRPLDRAAAVAEIDDLLATA